MTPLTVANGILLALVGLALVYSLGQLLRIAVFAWLDSLPEPPEPQLWLGLDVQHCEHCNSTLFHGHKCTCMD